MHSVMPWWAWLVIIALVIICIVMGLVIWILHSLLSDISSAWCGVVRKHRG